MGQTGGTDTLSLLSGKWFLFKDSVYNNGSFFIDQGGTNYYPTSGDYYGTSSDYYNFQSNGTLSVMENGQNYSSGFSIYPNAKLVVNDLLVYDTGRIVTLTGNKATLDWQASSGYGGQYYKRLYLYK